MLLDDVLYRAVPYVVGAFEFAENVAGTALRGARRAAVGAPARAPPALNMEQELIVITGGNAGLGEALAVEGERREERGQCVDNGGPSLPTHPTPSVAARGADVILACRDPGRAADAATRVAAAATARRAGTGAPPGGVSTAALDLCKNRSAAALGTTLAAAPRRPTAIVCNAGVMAPTFSEVTEDGIDGQFAANFTGHHALVASFLTGVRAQRHGRQHAPSPDSCRIVFLSSVTHRGGRLDRGALEAAAAATTREAALTHAPRRPSFAGYADAKLACTLAAADLQRRFEAERGCPHEARRDVAVSVHPGLVDTALARAWLTGHDLLGPLAPILARPLTAAAPVLFKPVDVAVDDVVWALTAPAAVVAGRHTAGSRVVTPSRAARDARLAAALTAAAAAWTGVSVPACLA